MAAGTDLGYETALNRRLEPNDAGDPGPCSVAVMCIGGYKSAPPEKVMKHIRYAREGAKGYESNQSMICVSQCFGYARFLHRDLSALRGRAIRRETLKFSAILTDGVNLHCLPLLLTTINN